MRFWIYAILIILFIFGIKFLLLDSTSESTQIIEQEKSEHPDADLMRNYMKTEFNKLSFAEKVHKVRTKGFATCNQISDLCKKHPYIPNCKDSCGRLYEEWNVSMNATLNNSINSVEFVKELTTDAFNEFEEEIQREIIELGYFTSCDQILDFCLNVESTEGCHKYCNKYLLEPAYVGDIYNNGSQVVVKN